jgi:hypothetical protein
MNSESIYKKLIYSAQRALGEVLWRLLRLAVQVFDSASAFISMLTLTRPNVKKLSPH